MVTFTFTRVLHPCNLSTTAKRDSQIPPKVCKKDTIQRIET